VARKRSPAVQSLEAALRSRTAPAAEALVDTLDNHRVRCHACGHRCLVLDGLDGVCRVRHNRGGVLYVPHGYVGALQVDPIEKKPFFHAFPGEDALSFGMLGCDLHCGYCQNWLTSQALRDESSLSPPQDVTPAQLVALATRRAVPVMVSTYNEPLITSEWAVEVFARARDAGITCGYVSNGNGTRRVLEYLRPYVQLYKVDLKSFRDAGYRQLGGRLETVLETIRDLHDLGFWVEIVTLLVPGWNDGEEELRGMAEFLASVSPDIPWHVTAYHRDYKMRDHADTTAADLVRAAGWGREAGLRFVYAGNLPGRVGELETTFCPGCRTALVERHGFAVLSTALTDGGTCPQCRARIPGFWSRTAVHVASPPAAPRPVAVQPVSPDPNGAVAGP
jgi:pyruvate formate lyase activating enzyme